MKGDMGVYIRGILEETASTKTALEEALSIFPTAPICNFKDKWVAKRVIEECTKRDIKINNLREMLDRLSYLNSEYIRAVHAISTGEIFAELSESEYKEGGTA